MGVTTNLTWSFRMFMNYEILRRQNMDWRLGVGYFHHSNGHTRITKSRYKFVSDESFGRY